MISGVWSLLDATAKPSHSIYLISYLSRNLLRTSYKGLALGRIGRFEDVACGIHKPHVFPSFLQFLEPVKVLKCSENSPDFPPDGKYNRM